MAPVGLTSVVGVPAALLVVAAAAGGVARPADPPRAVSWWWSAPEGNGTDPETDGMLQFVREHKNIVTTLIMRCGVYTCVRNATRGDCTNNDNKGGQITGELMPACARALPVLKELGIRAELWLGEDDSLLSARTLFNNSEEIAAQLLTVSRKYPGIVGFNIDLECSGGTQQDREAYAEFLGTVTRTLNSAPEGPIRFSADVSCGSQWAGLIGDCQLLAASGVNKIMNMDTYNAGGAAEWWYFKFAPMQNISRSVLGAGLGCWIDSRTNNTWSITPASAKFRMCVLANESIQEIDMFDLRQGSADPAANFPEEFWIPQLEMYMSGAMCSPEYPPQIKCPAASKGPTDAWKMGDDPGCCVSEANRGPGLSCNITCAEAECAAAHMHWRQFNFSVHPYECCNNAI